MGHKSSQTDRKESVTDPVTAIESASVALSKAFKTSIGIQTEAAPEPTVISLKRKVATPMLDENLRHDRVEQQSKQESPKTLLKPIVRSPTFFKLTEATAETEKLSESVKLISEHSNIKTERAKHLLYVNPKALSKTSNISFQKIESKDGLSFHYKPTQIIRNKTTPLAASRNTPKNPIGAEDKYSVQKVKKYLVKIKQSTTINNANTLPRPAESSFNQTNTGTAVELPETRKLLFDTFNTPHESAQLDLESNNLFFNRHQVYFAADKVLPPKSQKEVLNSTKVYRELTNALSEKSGSPQKLTEASFSEAVPKLSKEFLPKEPNKNFEFELKMRKSAETKNNENNNKRLENLEQEIEKIRCELNHIKKESVKSSDLERYDILVQKMQELTKLLTDMHNTTKTTDSFIPEERVTNKHCYCDMKPKAKVKTEEKPKKKPKMKVEKKPSNKPRNKLKEDTTFKSSLNESQSSSTLFFTCAGSEKKDKKDNKEKREEKKVNKTVDQKKEIKKEEKTKSTKECAASQTVEPIEPIESNASVMTDNKNTQTCTTCYGMCKPKPKPKPKPQDKAASKAPQLNEAESFCLYCEQMHVPVVSEKLLDHILRIIGDHDCGDVALTILLQPNNLYHINLAILKTGESLGCLYATEEGIVNANEARVFQKFLTFYIVDASNSTAQKNKILSHTFEFIKN